MVGRVGVGVGVEEGGEGACSMKASHCFLRARAFLGSSYRKKINKKRIKNKIKNKNKNKKLN